MSLEINIRHSFIETIKLLIDDKIIIHKEYNSSNNSNHENAFFNITDLDYNQSVPIEVIYVIKNTSINLTQFEFSYKRSESTIAGISNVIFNNPKLMIGKQDYELVYNDDDLIPGDSDITILKYIFYLLILLTIITYLSTNQVIREFVISNIKKLRRIKITSTIIREGNRSVSYDNL
jgi:hypothetical protein